MIDASDDAVVRGEDLIESGDLDGAYALTIQVTQHQPDNARAFNNLGVIHHLQGRNEMAAEALSRALALDPTPDTAVNLFHVYMAMGSFERIKAFLSEQQDLWRPQDLAEINVRLEAFKATRQ